MSARRGPKKRLPWGNWGEKRTVYRDDVGHGEEGGEAGAELSEEVAALALLPLWEKSVCDVDVRLI
jgi:hypothetical protein